MCIIHDAFQEVDTLVKLKDLLDRDWSPAVGTAGGRFFVHQGAYFRLNWAVQHLELIANNTGYTIEEMTAIVARLRALEAKEVRYESRWLKIATTVRQFLGNFFYQREKILEEFSKGKCITGEQGDYRYLVFGRGGGKVACRVFGTSSRTFLRKTDGDFDFATRAILRLRNLVVNRGEGVRDHAHMVGPGDFYGPLEKPHLYVYTIEIKEGFPRFYRRKKEEVFLPQPSPLSTDFTDKAVQIAVQWHKGTNEDIEQIKRQYRGSGQAATGESLFPNSGILEVGQEEVQLPIFDATQCDLSSFKAQLVRNDQPFVIATEKVGSSDSFCPVSYLFEEEYAQGQMQEGGGLFLETHDFSQTMTPLDEQAGGFIMLGRWADEAKSQLELIGVKIPFGFTLIVGKDCIHGDTTFKGMYMMAMTSNHKTMQTADTVFLKNPTTKRNVRVLMNDAPSASGSEAVNDRPAAPRPLFFFREQEKEQFYWQVHGGLPLYNPFSRIWNPSFEQV